MGQRPASPGPPDSPSRPCPAGWAAGTGRPRRARPEPGNRRRSRPGLGSRPCSSRRHVRFDQRLAAGTPEAAALLPERAERLSLNRRAASSTPLMLAVEYIGPAAGSKIAGGGLLRTPPVHEEQLLGALHQASEVLHLGHRRAGMEPLEEEHFSAIERPDPGEISLIKEGLPDRPIRLRRHPPPCLLRIPVRTKQVRAEVADRVRLVGGRDQLNHRQPVADRVMLSRCQDRSNFIVRPAGPATPGAKDAPGALHPEMSVQSHLVVEPEQLMLSA